MSTTPPGKHRPQATSSFGLGGAPGQRGPSTPAKIGILVGLVVVAAVAVFLLAGENGREAEPVIPSEELSPSPASNLACPSLQEAEVALEDDDEDAFRAAVHEAARIAEQTLETSGEAFGLPERVSIELDFALQDRKVDLESLKPRLAEALSACAG